MDKFSNTFAVQSSIGFCDLVNLNLRDSFGSASILPSNSGIINNDPCPISCSHADDLGTNNNDDLVLNAVNNFKPNESNSHIQSSVGLCNHVYSNGTSTSSDNTKI